MEDVFEKMKDYKLNALARSQKTVDEDTRRFSKISTTIRAKSLNDITDQDIRNWFVKSFLTTKPSAHREKRKAPPQYCVLSPFSCRSQ